MKRSFTRFLKKYINRFSSKNKMHRGDVIIYSKWEDAFSASMDGYTSNSILERVKQSLLKVKNGEAVYERDSVIFNTIQYSWPILACLMWIASQNSNTLSILDYGGSLGSSYFQNYKFLRTLDHLQWSIIEQDQWVECGKKYFENEELRFYHNIPTCLSEQMPHAILLSGVLQYIESPYAILEDIIKCGFEYILVDRTAFALDGYEVLTLYKVPPEIYQARFPMWYFNYEKFKTILLKHYELIEEFDAIDKVEYPSFFKGFIFRKNLQRC